MLIGFAVITILSAGVGIHEFLHSDTIGGVIACLPALGVAAIYLRATWEPGMRAQDERDADLIS